MSLYKRYGKAMIYSLLLIIFLSGSAYAQPFNFVKGAKSKFLPFKYVKNLIILPVTINDKGPYNFILDTGIGVTLITDPSLTDSLGLKNLRTIRITGFGEGNELTAAITPSLKVGITKNINGEISAAVLKEDAFNLSAYTGIPIHGLIGYEFFSSFIVRINYSTNSLRLYSPYYKYAPRKGYRIPITIEEKKPYLIAQLSVVPGKSTQAKLIIDTGAGHPISLETDSAVPYKVPEPRIRANLGVGLSGAINGYISRIPMVKLGKYELKNVITAFPDYRDAAGKVGAINRNGNVGNTILSRFTIVLDYNNNAMYLRPNSKIKAAFEHDMSGMELAQAPPDYRRLFITRVEPGSAAEEAGLEENDEILEINLKPITEIGMESIAELFRSGNKRSFMLRLLPHGETKSQIVILTLKRRI